MNIDLSKKFYEHEANSEIISGYDIADLPGRKKRKTEAFVVDSSLDTHCGNTTPLIAVKKENARSRIAFLYVSSFLVIIIIVFFFSLLTMKKTEDIKDLLITVSGIMSGPLGFIIGYYFKSEDENNK